jgi:hypothetical protein
MMRRYTEFAKRAVPYMVIAGVAFFIFRGIFAAGPMSGYDNSIHYYESYFLANTLIARGHWISGFCMQGLAGCPMFLYHPQLGFLLIVFLNKIAFIPLELAYKLIVLFSYVLLGAAFYRLSSRRFGRMPSLVMAVSLMLQKEIYCDKILAGIWNNYLATGIFLIFFDMLDRYAEDLTARRAALLGFILALIILAHLFTAIFAFLSVFIYAAYCLKSARSRSSLARRGAAYSIIPAAALALSAYYLYGFFATAGYLAKFPPKDIATGLEWGLKSLFGPIEGSLQEMRAFLLDVPVILRTIFSILGVYFFLTGKGASANRRFLTSVLAMTVVSLVFFSDIFVNLFGWWRALPLFGSLKTNRFLIYIHMGMYILAAYGLANFLERAKFKRFLLAALGGVIVVSSILSYELAAKEASRTISQSSEIANIFKIWRWVDENIPEGTARVVYQNTVGNINDPILRRSDVFALSGVFTKVPQIGSFLQATGFPQEEYMRDNDGLILGRPAALVDGAYISGVMSRLNAGAIVTVEPRLGGVLAGSRLFIKEKEFGPCLIFRLKDFEPAWAHFTKKAGCRILRLENERLEFNIINEDAGNEMNIKFSYHPFWEARLDGRPVKLEQDDYGMMKILLKEKGAHDLILEYKPVSRAWLAVSAIGFLVILFMAAFEGASTRPLRHAA